MDISNKVLAAAELGAAKVLEAGLRLSTRRERRAKRWIKLRTWLIRHAILANLKKGEFTFMYGNFRNKDKRLAELIANQLNEAGGLFEHLTVRHVMTRKKFRGRIYRLLFEFNRRD